MNVSFSPVVALLRDELCESFACIFAPLREKFLQWRPVNEVDLQGVLNFMFLRKGSGALLVVLVLGVLVTAQTQRMRRIATGLWGGQHISIEVGEKSATVEYDCASGVIDGPLVVDNHGNFDLRGIHKMERGGPVRADENPKEHPATYTGSIKGDTMTLTLKLEGLDDETFTLEKGKQGELVKCK